MSWLFGDWAGEESPFDAEGENSWFNVPDGTHGESFTSSTPISGVSGFGNFPVNPLTGFPDWRRRQTPDAQPARVTSPFDVFRDRRDQALERLRNPPGFENQAIFTWGEASESLPTSGNKGSVPDLLQSGFKVVDPKKKDKKPDDNKNNVKRWSESKRVFKKVKVSSEEDPETYIIVQRAVVSIIQTHEYTVIMEWKLPRDAPGSEGLGAGVLE